MEFKEKNYQRDFARRTLKNLEYINNHFKDNNTELYEVTQLLNSFLGLIVFPQQDNNIKIVDNNVETDIFKELKKGIILNQYTNSRQYATLDNIIYHIRNAVAHGNIKFRNKTIDNKKCINYIYFEDMRVIKVKNNPNKTERYVIRISIDMLSRLVSELPANLYNMGR